MSPDGTDLPECGDLQHPCKTINHAVEKKARTNDVIKIDGRSGSIVIQQRIQVSKAKFCNITITSVWGVPTITTNDRNRNEFLSFKGNIVCKTTYQITIKNLSFQNVHLLNMRESHFDVASMRFFVQNCKLDFGGTVGGIGYSHILIRQKIPTFLLEMKNCSIHGSSNDGVFKVESFLHDTSKLTLRIEQSYFYDVAFAISGGQLSRNQSVIRSYVTYEILDSNFISNIKTIQKHTLISIHGDPKIKAKHYALKVDVSIKRSLFQNRTIDTRYPIPSILHASGDTKVRIETSEFLQNTGRLGGAIALYTTNKRWMKHSRFEGNRAVEPTICGGGELNGNGGAVLVYGHSEKSTTTFTNVTFRNNGASCFGDAVCAINSGHIRLKDSLFESSARDRKLTQGSIWYSKSVKLLIGGSNFRSTGAVWKSTTIFFADAMEGIQHVWHKTYFECPLGSNIRYDIQTGGTENKDSFPTDDRKNENNFQTGNRKNNAKIRTGDGKHKVLSQPGERKTVAVECKACRDKTYTEKFSYATVANFSSTNQEIHYAKCQTCPFGARCDTSIMPKKNFWGYVSKGKVHMIACPPGYCCQNPTECTNITVCHKHRTGVLCGECVAGRYPSFFGNHCVERKHDSILTFWLYFTSAAFVLFLLIAYMQEICGLALRLVAGSVIRNLTTRLTKYKQKSSGCAEKAEPDAKPTWDQDDIGEHNQAESDPTNCSETLIRPEETQLCTDTQIRRDEATLSATDTAKQPGRNPNMGGIIKILFFYYQMNTLLMVYDSESSQFEAVDAVKSILRFFFNFEPSAVIGSNVGCPVANFNTVMKILLKASFPLLMLCAAAIMYVLAHILSNATRRTSILDALHNFKSSILAGSLQVILLGYSTLTSHSLQLLTCVSLADDKQILYVAGNVSCFQSWQYALLLFVICWLIPFIYLLYAASKSLKDGSLAVWRFYAAMFLPLPFAIYSLVRLRGSKENPIAEVPSSTAEESGSKSNQSVNQGQPSTEEHDHVYHNFNAMAPLLHNTSMPDPDPLRERLLYILRGSFRRVGNKSSKLPWEPMLIFQRLLLLTLHTFLVNPVTKSLSLLCALFLLANLNMIIKPFHNTLLNMLNCVCFFFLFVNGLLNSLYAYIYVQGIAIEGPLPAILSSLQVIVLGMQLSFPCLAMLAVILVIATRLLLLVYKILKATSFIWDLCKC